MARLTIRKAVEQIALELDDVCLLDDLAQEAARRAGRPVTKNTPATVREALYRVNCVVRCGVGTYAPASLALDGKAFRVRLTYEEAYWGRLNTGRLNPFFKALGQPPIRMEEGQEVKIRELSQKELDDLEKEMRRVFAESVYELRRSGTVSLENIRAYRAPSRMDVVSIDLSPLGFDHKSRGKVPPCDLIFRWDKRLGALVVSVRVRGTDSPKKVAAEDNLLADFFVARTAVGYHGFDLDQVLLEAYARHPALGQTPGSHAFEVIAGDPRLRASGGNPLELARLFITSTERPSYLEPAQIADDVEAANRRYSGRASIEEHSERVRKARAQELERLDLTNAGSDAEGRVVLLRKPSHEEIIDEWSAWLTEQGVGDSVRERKINHLKTFIYHLDTRQPEAPTHILDVGLSDLNTFFFWTYIRRFPNSSSDAASFTLDLRDFYQLQESQGRIPDARFAELIYCLRDMIVERLELYGRINPNDEDYGERFEQLFSEC